MTYEEMKVKRNAIKQRTLDLIAIKAKSKVEYLYNGGGLNFVQLAKIDQEIAELNRDHYAICVATEAEKKRLQAAGLVPA